MEPGSCRGVETRGQKRRRMSGEVKVVRTPEQLAERNRLQQISREERRRLDCVRNERRLNERLVAEREKRDRCVPWTSSNRFPKALWFRLWDYLTTGNVACILTLVSRQWYVWLTCNPKRTLEVVHGSPVTRIVTKERVSWKSESVEKSLMVSLMAYGDRFGEAWYSRTHLNLAELPARWSYFDLWEKLRNVRVLYQNPEYDVHRYMYQRSAFLPNNSPTHGHAVLCEHIAKWISLQTFRVANEPSPLFCWKRWLSAPTAPVTLKRLEVSIHQLPKTDYNSTFEIINDRQICFPALEHVTLYYAEDFNVSGVLLLHQWFPALESLHFCFTNYSEKNLRPEQRNYVRRNRVHLINHMFRNATQFVRRRIELTLDQFELNDSYPGLYESITTCTTIDPRLSELFLHICSHERHGSWSSKDTRFASTFDLEYRSKKVEVLVTWVNRLLLDNPHVVWFSNDYIPESTLQLLVRRPLHLEDTSKPTCTCASSHNHEPKPADEIEVLLPV